MDEREKAIDLVDLFYNEVKYYERAKQCALICVDEMYNISVQNDNVIQMNYLIDVKKEIELL